MKKSNNYNVIIIITIFAHLHKSQQGNFFNKFMFVFGQISLKMRLKFNAT